jgi:uncharacterized protein YfiM (DUF2279 family)
VLVATNDTTQYPWGPTYSTTPTGVSQGGHYDLGRLNWISSDGSSTPGLLARSWSSVSTSRNIFAYTTTNGSTSICSGGSNATACPGASADLDLTSCTLPCYSNHVSIQNLDEKMTIGSSYRGCFHNYSGGVCQLICDHSNMYANPFDNEIDLTFVANPIKGSGEQEFLRLAHTRSENSWGSTPDEKYQDQPHAVIDRSGRYVVFTSDFSSNGTGGYNTGSSIRTDVYMVRVPEQGSPYATDGASQFHVDHAGRFWQKFSTGSWAKATMPTGIVMAGGLAMVNTAGGYESVFSIGSNKHLYEYHYSGSAWSWSDRGRPSCGDLAGDPSAFWDDHSPVSAWRISAVCASGDVAFWDGTWTTATVGSPYSDLRPSRVAWTKNYWYFNGGYFASNNPDSALLFFPPSGGLIGSPGATADGKVVQMQDDYTVYAYDENTSAITNVDSGKPCELGNEGFVAWGQPNADHLSLFAARCSSGDAIAILTYNAISDSWDWSIQRTSYSGYSTYMPTSLPTIDWNLSVYSWDFGGSSGTAYEYP